MVAGKEIPNVPETEHPAGLSGLGWNPSPPQHGSCSRTCPAQPAPTFQRSVCEAGRRVRMCRDEGLQPTGCPGCLVAFGLRLISPSLISSSVSPLQEKEAALLGRAQQHWHLAFMCNFYLKINKCSSASGSSHESCSGQAPSTPASAAPTPSSSPQGLTVQDGCIQGSPSTCMGSSLEVLQQRIGDHAAACFHCPSGHGLCGDGHRYLMVTAEHWASLFPALFSPV